MAISELDTEERVRESLQNNAFYLYAFFFSH